MPALDYPILEIDAEFGGSIGQVTGIFEMPKSTVEQGVRTGPLVNNEFSTLVTMVLDAIDDGGSGRAGVTIDNGGGQFYTDIDLEGIGESDGQWGYSPDPDVFDEATATGGDRTQKAQVLINYIRHTSPDSLVPARLKYGEFHPDGAIEDHLDVYIEDPTMIVSRDTSSVYEGSLTLIETVDLTDPITETDRSK